MSRIDEIVRRLEAVSGALFVSEIGHNIYIYDQVEHEDICICRVENGRYTDLLLHFPADMRFLLDELDTANSDNERLRHTIGWLVGALQDIIDETSIAGSAHPVRNIDAVNRIDSILESLGLSSTDATWHIYEVEDADDD